MFEDQSKGNQTKGSGTSGEKESPATDKTANYASDINSSTMDGDAPSNGDLRPLQVGVADNSTPPRLADLKSDLEKLLATIASASPGRKAALCEEKLSLVRRISRADQLERNMKINAMRVRIGEQVDPPPPDRKPRFEKHTVRKGSKRCGPREEPAKETRKGTEDCWDTEIPPRRWKKKKRKLTNLEKEMEAAGLDVRVKMDTAMEGEGERPKKKDISIWEKLKWGHPL